MNPARIGIETAIAGMGGRCTGLWYFVFVRAWPSDLPPNMLAPTGSNPLYNDVIGWAVDQLDGTIVDPTGIVDTDIATIQSHSRGQLIDLCEYRAILTGLGSYIQTDESAQDRSQSWGAMASRFQARADKLETLYKYKLKTATANIHFTTIRLPIGPRPDSVIGYGLF